MRSAPAPPKILLDHIHGAQRHELHRGRVLDAADLKRVYDWLANPSH